MESKRIEGLWDCSYCGQTGILARYDRCQACGSARIAQTQFYMPKDIAAATLSSEEAAKTSNAPDWLCSFCGGLNSADRTTCSGCGSAREQATQDYGTLHSQTPEGVFSQNADSSKDLGQDAGFFGKLKGLLRRK